MALSINDSKITHYIELQYAQCRYTKCFNLVIVMLNVIMMSVVRLNGIAPCKHHFIQAHFIIHISQRKLKKIIQDYIAYT